MARNPNRLPGRELERFDRILLPQVNDPTKPTLAFGEGDMGFYAESAYVLGIAVNGTKVLEIDLNGNFQGAVMNNLNAFDFGERVLNIMTSPVLLNVMCEDPGAGTLYDISGNGHDGTYTGTWVTAQRLKQGRTWKINPNGTDNYIDFGDHNDFSFGDGTNDSGVTFFGLVEVVDTANYQDLFTKSDVTTALLVREFCIQFKPTEELRIRIYDESADVFCARESDNPIGVGIHSFAIVYDGSGGATAADGITIYFDGEVVASTATNAGTYVAMENLTTPLWFGADESASGTPASFFAGDIGVLGIDAAEWSAEDVHRFHQLCLANYSEDGSGL